MRLFGSAGDTLRRGARRSVAFGLGLAAVQGTTSGQPSVPVSKGLETRDRIEIPNDAIRGLKAKYSLRWSRYSAYAARIVAHASHSSHSSHASHASHASHYSGSGGGGGGTTYYPAPSTAPPPREPAPRVAPLYAPPEPAQPETRTAPSSTNWSTAPLCLTGTSGDPDVPVIETGSGLEIALLSGLVGTHVGGRVSARTYDVKGGASSVKVVPATGAGTVTCFAMVGGPKRWFRFCLWSGNLYFQVNDNGKVTASSIPYDPKVCRYWRFRHDATRGLVFWEIGPDRQNWRIGDAASVGPSIEDVRFELSAGTVADSADPGSAVFDSLTIEPSGV